MNSRLILLPLFILAIAPHLTGCASGSQKRGSAPPRERVALRVVEKPGAATFEPEDHRVFVAKLDQMLFTEGRDFTRGNGGYTLTWEPVKVERGSRALRYVVGMGAGRAEVIIRGQLTDPRGRVVGSGEGRGTQTFGLYGGSFASAVEESAEELAAWAGDGPR